MKCLKAIRLSVVVLAGMTLINSTRAQSDYAIVERGPNHRVWQKLVAENGTNRKTLNMAKPIFKTRLGLCFWTHV